MGLQYFYFSLHYFATGFDFDALNAKAQKTHYCKMCLVLLEISRKCAFILQCILQNDFEITNCFFTCSS